MILTSSPHALGEDTIERIMWAVVISLIPATLAGLYYFGWDAFQVIIITVASTLAAEALYQKMSGHKIVIRDGSAAVTGLLLALTLPTGSPWWLSVIGGFFAIIICKQLYGGLGFNPFNPALMARVFLLIAFPLHMTRWSVPHPLFTGIDAKTGATPLGDLQVARLTGKGIGEAARLNLFDAFIGNIGGSIGEISALALLIGAAYLLYKQYITWHIPVSMIGTVMVFSGIFWWIEPAKYANPVFHLLTGGLIIGAFFMATDMVTCPVTLKGQLLFGFGCGLITIIIRMWGGYPEGVSFAIVLMNIVTPMIDRYIRPVRYGAIKKKEA
ncbi:MAG: electron transporter RnfD [Nitrospirae bacterium RIFCSPHIGHO2_02_FULL_42_12]|nr:MAG: electron transporter RnfD [Nitrospirae bacterium RIFCSPHIGHO2_02_FULL_42_12]